MWAYHKFLIFILILFALLCDAHARQDIKRDIIVYGGDFQYAPYEFTNNEGNPDGFHIDLIKAIGNVMGFDVQYDLGKWSEIRKKLEHTKEVDVSDMFYLEGRKNLVEYAAEHAVISHQIVARKRTQTVNTLEDIRGMKVLVEAGTTLYEFLRENDFDITLIPVESEVYALRQLAAGKYDIAITSQYQAHVFVEEFGLTNLSIEGPLILPLKLSFVVRKGRTDLIEKINTGLEILKQTGEYSKIYVKWFGNEDDSSMFFYYFKWGFLITLIISVLVGFWILSLKGQVNRKTKEIENQLNMKIAAERRVATKNIELKKRNEELDQFAYSIAHDIRSPLTSILGLVEVMKLELKDALTRDYLSKLEKSGRRLTAYVDQVLMYSTSELVEQNPVKIDFEEVVTKALGLYEYLDGASRIDIQYDVNVNKPFYSDRNKVEIVFNNLICNAIQFQRKQEENPFLKIDIKNDNISLQISIEDNGEGIEELRKTYIFRMFYRGSNQSQGSGLGLYVVNEAIKKLNGIINVESTAGKGTKFSIRLPYLV